MLSTKLMVGALGISLASGLIPSGLSASSELGSASAGAAAPCEPTLTTTARPRTPTGLRIVPGDMDHSGPFADLDDVFEPAAAGIAAHTYFDMLSLRTDCMVAYHLRSDAQLDSLETAKSGMSERGEMRFPIAYDSVMDGALFRIDPRFGSTDGEGKRLPVMATDGSLLLTWDLRFDAGHRYQGSGYLARHKTYMVGWRSSASGGDNRWLGLKTEYINAAQARQGVAELYSYVLGETFLGTGSSSGPQESLQPSAGRFFIEADTWTRVWIYIQDIGQPVSYVSIWAADPSRGPVQLNNRNAMVTPPGGLNKFWFEYDTSSEDASNGEMRSWNRNFVALKNVPPTAVSGLLQRPTP